MKPFFIAIGAIVILVLAGVFVLPQSSGTGRTDSEVIADAGMHWHPMLEMYVKGEKIEIPQNIGIGAVHQPMHTHDDLPIIHLEFPEKQTVISQVARRVYGDGSIPFYLFQAF